MASDPRINISFVGIFYEPFDHDHGHWCNTCHLATGIRIITIVIVNGRPDSLTTRLICSTPECDSINITPAAPDEIWHC